VKAIDEAFQALRLLNRLSSHPADLMANEYNDEADAPADHVEQQSDEEDLPAIQDDASLLHVHERLELALANEDVENVQMCIEWIYSDGDANFAAAAQSGHPRSNSNLAVDSSTSTSTQQQGTQAHEKHEQVQEREQDAAQMQYERRFVTSSGGYRYRYRMKPDHCKRALAVALTAHHTDLAVSLLEIARCNGFRIGASQLSALSDLCARDEHLPGALIVLQSSKVEVPIRSRATGESVPHRADRYVTHLVNNAIRACGTRNHDFALDLFSLLVSYGRVIMPTFEALAHTASTDRAKCERVLDIIKMHNLQPSIHVYNSVLASYRTGQSSDASAAVTRIYGADMKTAGVMPNPRTFRLLAQLARASKDMHLQNWVLADLQEAGFADSSSALSMASFDSSLLRAQFTLEEQLEFEDEDHDYNST
jgi:hypothetical protein